MLHAPATALPSADELATLSTAQFVTLVEQLTQTIATLEHQLEWFKRQLFGAKSERFIVESDARQLHLGELIAALPVAPEQRKTVAAHSRRIATTDAAGNADGESIPFFDESRVPVETIRLPNPQLDGLSADQFEVIGEKVSYRLAQRPGSYVVLRYVRPLVKRRDSQTLHCAPAPQGVIEGSRADVSFIAGLLIDKIGYHLPLYRQHQRLIDAGINVSRPWLTQLAQQGAGLLEPIYEAQFASIRGSRVKAIDETPIKAGRAGPGKMKATYYWPVYGEQDEVCFPWFPSRGAEHVYRALGLTATQGSVLLTDGYQAYDQYVKKIGVTHAQCWAHTRRAFFDAQAVEPQASGEALEQIGALYAVEEKIRERKLAGEDKRIYRLLHAKPIVDGFFDWVDRQFERQGLLPSNPLTKALAYARERRAGLEVFLTDADVAIDTNHLERALRAIPMGRKAWLFCWTELGAKHVGIVQSLLVTCRLHGVDPYTYLVDVLQRVGQHPAARVAELTPRLWKQHFAANPLRSDLYRLRE
jgi:transposase